MILLDTDICVEAMRGNATVLARWNQAAEPAAVCFMTVAELFYGAAASNRPDENRRLVASFLEGMHVFQSDLPIEWRFGVLKAALKQKKIPLADADVFIAAVAMEKCRLLVTGNTRHFRVFTELALDDWTRE